MPGTKTAATRRVLNDELELLVEQLEVDKIKPQPGESPRRHGARQLRALRRSIAAFGFLVPLLVDREDRLITGAARLSAARDLGTRRVPAVRVDHLDEAQVRAFRIADNRLVELGEWDEDVLALEFQALLDLDFEVELTGFEVPEIDVVLERDRQRDLPPEIEPRPGPAITAAGDLWVLDHHRLICGDARDKQVLSRLMRRDTAAMVFSDPPYNVPIAGHVCGLGSIHHREFAMASGEMTEAEFAEFLGSFLAVLLGACRPGALIYLCIDWRSASLLETVARRLSLETIAWCVWAKGNAGMGALYRSQHEFVLVFKARGSRHRNNVALGRYGRHRSNLWQYAGASSPNSASRAELANHPTPKPPEMIADAIIDCTAPYDVVLDPFLGGGATLVACERTDRCCRGIEIDPLYVDASIRRWQRVTGGTAVSARTGQSFAEMEAGGAALALPAPPPVEG